MMIKRFEIPNISISDVLIEGSERPTHNILLLHGFSANGRYILKRLGSVLPKDARIIAPNGPFILPKKKSTHWEVGFCWYFYDHFRNIYVIDFKLAVGMLKGLMEQLGSQQLPTTIIGHSQGGYLAPFAGQALPNIKQVIGIGSVFRYDLLGSPLSFPISAIHGRNDDKVSPERAFDYYQKLKQQGTQGGEFYWAENEGHDLTIKISEILKPLLD